MLPTVRSMTPVDVPAATSAVLRGEWGDRRLFFRWAAASPRSHPFVAELGGEIVGTSVGTNNGAAGWIGAVFVAESQRGRGLGRALTQAAIDAVEAAGCRTLLLVATSAGRPLYERMGFRLDTTYHTIEAAGATDGGTTLGGWRPEDLPSMATLDAAATGEDRRHLLEAFATVDSARVVRDEAGDVRAFVVRAPWGGGATVAPDSDDAVRILEARRAAAGPGRTVRAGVLAENLAALDRLRALGWTEVWQAPRLIRGEPLDWRPEALWGQFNHAIG